jgi:hypothetical protein
VGFVTESRFFKEILFFFAKSLLQPMRALPLLLLLTAEAPAL